MRLGWQLGYRKAEYTATPSTQAISEGICLVCGPRYGFIVYQSTSDPGLTTQLNRMREYFGPVDIQRLHIALYDEFGRIIDLNNMDWSITLAFELLYN